MMVARSAAFREAMIAGRRPADVPATWRVFNAPRPLHGHREWKEYGVGCGIFFAAVNPEGPQADWCIEENQLLHAREVRYAGEGPN